MALHNEARQLAGLLKAIDAEHLVQDPRFATQLERRANHKALTAILDGIFAKRDLGEWRALLQKAGVTFGTVSSVDEAADDAQARDIGAIVPFADGKGHTVSSPFHLDHATKVAPVRAPAVGQHSEQVLKEAGYSSDEIARLRTISDCWEDTMPLLYKKQGHTGILTLSRPAARNCWGQDYADGLLKHLDEAADDDEVRSVILTGDEAGGAFSAGANLRDPNTHNTRSAEAFIKRMGRARNFPSNLVSDFPKPMIAAVNGYAIGIGCIITFCCDLIVASERAEWRLPQVALGILPNYGGATRLARIIGKGLAMRVALGFPLKADEAHRIGLAQWLVPHDQLMEQALAIADHIAGLPPLAVRMVKESMNRGQDIPNIADASLVDAYRFMALEMSEDKAEAHEAWRARRKPSFRGR